jgi:hypothetical protein
VAKCAEFGQGLLRQGKGGQISPHGETAYASW